MLAVGAPVALHTLHLHLHRGDPLVHFRIGPLGAALQGLRGLGRRLLRPQLLLFFRLTLPGYVALLLLLLLRVVADDGAVGVLLAATASPLIKRGSSV